MPAANQSRETLRIRGFRWFGREGREDRLRFRGVVQAESRLSAEETSFAIPRAAGILPDQAVQRRPGSRPIAHLDLTSPQAIQDQRHDPLGRGHGDLAGPAPGRPRLGVICCGDRSQQADHLRLIAGLVGRLCQVEPGIDGLGALRISLQQLSENGV